MSVTFGFHNSLNGDRTYSAIEMSRIFNGIIKDGIFMSIGTSMMVVANGGMRLNVGVGRAWFNSTWTYNNSEFYLDLDLSEVVMNRIDTVVLEVDARDAVRANNIKIIKGTPGTVPVAPTLVRNTLVNQYPLADVYVGKNVLEVTQANITNRVGTSDTPFVTGILKTMDIDALVAQWESQYANWTVAKKNEFDNWTTVKKSEYDTWTADKKAEYDTWVAAEQAMYDTWISGKQTDFDAWFAILTTALDEDAAGNLLNMINATNVEVGALSTSFSDHLAEKATMDKLGHVKLSELNFIPKEEKDTPSGVAGLNGSGKIPIGHLDNLIIPNEVEVISVMGVDYALSNYTMATSYEYKKANRGIKINGLHGTIASYNNVTNTSGYVKISYQIGSGSEFFLPQVNLSNGAYHDYRHNLSITTKEKVTFRLYAQRTAGTSRVHLTAMFDSLEYFQYLEEGF